MSKKRTNFLLKKMNATIARYNKISDGDKVAVAVSGGKDSLSLLRLLLDRKDSIGERYDLLAVSIFPRKIRLYLHCSNAI